MGDDAERHMCELERALIFGLYPDVRVKLGGATAGDVCPNTANAAGPHVWRAAASGAAKECKLCKEIRHG